MTDTISGQPKQELKRGKPGAEQDAQDTLTVDLSRLRGDLLNFAQIGCEEDAHGTKGIYRTGFSDPDMEARQLLISLIEKAGGRGFLDEAGNVIGRWFEDVDAPTVVVGSHIDSVPAGGIFDGTLGVITGLECARVLKDKIKTPKHPLELVAFSDEEGRFGGMFGVQAYCGLTTLDWIRSAHDVNGERLGDAMRAQNLDPELALNAARRPEDIHRFVELHIEQGPVLAKQGLEIGVVEGISGVFKWVVRLIGKANHAGTSPMDMRSDAFMGLADFAHEIPRIIQEDGTDKSRITVGKVELKPGYPHTVPGEVEFSLVGRDMDGDVMRALADSCRKVLSSIARNHRLYFDFEELSWLEPRPCHPNIIDMFCRQAERLGLSHIVMPSGAGHDTQFMTEITEAGMIFVPSVDGVSHAPNEWTNWPDAEKGANLLLNTLHAYLME